VACGVAGRWGCGRANRECLVGLGPFAFSGDQSYILTGLQVVWASQLWPGLASAENTIEPYLLVILGSLPALPWTCLAFSTSSKVTPGFRRNRMAVASLDPRGGRYDVDRSGLGAAPDRDRGLGEREAERGSVDACVELRQQAMATSSNETHTPTIGERRER